MAFQNKNRREFHPAVSISSWLIAALAIELAAPSLLPLFGALALMLLLHGEAAHRFARLLWKARWLWLALAALYAWTMPGTLLWPSLAYSPSLEGTQAGLVRISRLVLMLATLARLLSEFSPAGLAGGLYLLARPFTILGLDRRALAVRLALTLEHLERPAGQNWLERLKSPVEETNGPDEMRLSIAPPAPKDLLLLFAAVVLLGVALFGAVQ